jgi:ABC-type transporter Mla subunit MlaD
LLADQALSRLLTNATGLSEDARLMFDEQNRASFKQVLSDLATVTQTLAARSQRLDQGMESAAQTFQSAGDFSRGPQQ